MQTGELRRSLLLDNRQLWSLGTVVMMRSIGFGATWPFMAIFFHDDLGVPVYYVGLIFGALAITSTFCQIAGGHLSDFRGRRATMLLGSSLGVLLYMSIIAALLFNGPVLVIAILFISTSMSGGFLRPAATSAVADVTAGEEREQGYAIYRILANIGWAVGPLIGSQIYNAGIVWIFAVVELTSVIQLGMILTLLKESIRTKAPARRGKRALSDFVVVDYALFAFSASTLLLMILTSQFSVTLPLFASLKAGVSSNLIGYIFGVNGLVVVAGQFPVIAVVRRMREIDGIIIGMLLYLIGYLYVGFSTSLSALMLDMVIITIGENFTTPTISTIVSRMAPPGKVGRYMAFTGMANSSGRALGPAVGSFLLYLLFSSSAAIWLSLDAFGIAALAIMLVIRHTRMVEREVVEIRV